MASRQPTRYYVEAGWDPALHTYYGQVWATADPFTGDLPDDPVLWVGTTDEQARTIDELRAALGPFAPLLDEDELELEMERAIKEGIVDEDDLDDVLANGPSREQVRGYLFRMERRWADQPRSLERARVRRVAAQHAEARRSGVLRFLRRSTD
jgi:hypothetical protein